MNLIKKILIAGCFALVICGCKKKGPSPDNYISYKLDGVYKSSKPEADYFDESLLLDSETDDGKLWIFFTGYPAPGTYNLKDIDTASISYNIGGDIYDSILTKSGTLVITSYDTKRISGTFEFTGSNGKSVKTITEGKFNTKVNQLGDSSPACDSTQDCYIDTNIYGVGHREKLILHLKPIRPIEK